MRSVPIHTLTIGLTGPIGCGKSTVLRRLSLPAVLSLPQASKHFREMPYVGVYISCSSELRSRFWLFPRDEYDKIEGDVVLFFSMQRQFIEGLTVGSVKG